MENKKYNVLVVDDHESIRNVAEIFLKHSYGERVNTMSATNGEEAIDIARNQIHTNVLDLVLLDIRMPLMNGIEARNIIAEIYKKNNKKLPKIVAYSADCVNNARDRYLAHGFDDYIPKPSPFENFRSVVGRYI